MKTDIKTEIRARGPRILGLKFKILALLLALSGLLMGCGSTGYSGGYSRSVNHYHHGYGAWGGAYYGSDVIIIDDSDIDIGYPDDAVNLPADDWDY